MSKQLHLKDISVHLTLNLLLEFVQNFLDCWQSKKINCVFGKLYHGSWCFSARASWIGYTGCPRRNGQNFGRVFLMLNYTDITQKTYIQSWTVTEIMVIEKCELVGCPRTVSRPWRHTHPLRMSGKETPLANIAVQWPWRDNEQLRPA